MGLNWNKIKSRALLFSENSYDSDAERVAFVIELYQRISSLLSKAAAKKRKKTKVIES